MPPSAESCVLVGIRDAQARIWKRKPSRVPGLGVGPGLVHGLSGPREGRTHWETTPPWSWLHLLQLNPSQAQHWWSVVKLGHLHFLCDLYPCILTEIVGQRPSVSRDCFSTQFLTLFSYQLSFHPGENQSCGSPGRTGHPTILPVNGGRASLFPGLALNMKNL